MPSNHSPGGLSVPTGAAHMDDPRQFYQQHNHDQLQESQGFLVNSNEQVTAVSPSVDQHQLMQANMNANMMRFMRNANSNKAYQKIVRLLVLSCKMSVNMRKNFFFFVLFIRNHEKTTD